jgi:DNA-directed RNA polymerase subunit RPC12/RpoP
MKDFTPGPNEKVPWKCGGCGHEWDAKIHTRTNATHPSGCPKCAGRHLHDLEVHCAQSDGRLDHLPREWAHPTKSIKDFAPGSNEKVPWKCGGCGHEWDATVSHRTNATHPSGCPVCNPGGRNRFERQDDPVDAARVSS